MRPRNGAEVRAFLQHRTDERPRAEIPAVQIDGAKASIRLFDTVDSWGEWWGMSSKEFASAVDELPSHIDTIELLINSPGGDAFEGVAIVNVMRAHQARTVAVVQGVAASAASFIACAADETFMSPNSTLMIHKAWGLSIGNADEHRSHADLLDKVDGEQAAIYTSKSGKSTDEVLELMRAETFMSADEAVAGGFADSVLSAPSDDDPPSEASARWTVDDIQAVAAELSKLGVTFPSAGEREDPTTDPGEPASVDPEQASRLLASLTFHKENPNE